MANRKETAILDSALQKSWDALFKVRAETVNDVLAARLDDPALAAAFAPLAPLRDAEYLQLGGILQAALELPATERLHALARERVMSGRWAAPVFVRVRPAKRQPKRSLGAIFVDRAAELIYASERDVISMWSTEGEHLEDFAGPRFVQKFYETAEGTIRAAGGGQLWERPRGAKAFSLVRKQLANTCFVGERWLVTIASKYWPTRVTLVFIDLANGEQKTLVLSEENIPALAIDETRLVCALVVGDVLQVIDLASMSMKSLPLPVFDLSADLMFDANGELRLDLRLDGDSEARQFRIERTKKLSLVPESWPGPIGGTPLNAGLFLVFNGGSNEIVDAAGRRGQCHAMRHGGLYAGAGDVVAISHTSENAPPTVFERWHPALQPRVASAKAKPEKPARKPATGRAKIAPPLLPWLARLTVKQADFDVDDTYVFSCAVDAHGNLDVKFESDAGNGAFTCVASALENGTSKIEIAQGHATFGADPETFPPFLMPRAMFARLKEGTEIEWPTIFVNAPSLPLTITGGGTATLVIDGKKVSLPIVKARGGGTTFAILDNADWPVVLDGMEADCGYKVIRASAGGGASASAADSKHDDGWRRFEVDEKFWAIKLDGDAYLVRFGKQGTNGQQKRKEFPSAQAATVELAKLVAEKTKKGYEEVR